MQSTYTRAMAHDWLISRKQICYVDSEIPVHFLLFLKSAKERRVANIVLKFEHDFGCWTIWVLILWKQVYCLQCVHLDMAWKNTTNRAHFGDPAQDLHNSRWMCYYPMQSTSLIWNSHSATQVNPVGRSFGIRGGFALVVITLGDLLITACV